MDALSYIFAHPSSIAYILNVILVMIVAVRVIMNRPSTGVALAWLMVAGVFPVAGPLLYFLIGERRIGRSRAARMVRLRADYEEVANAAHAAELTKVDWSKHAPAIVGMNQLGNNLVRSPTVRGSKLTLYSDTQEVLKAIAEDIDAAQTGVLMEFYIWSEGGSADDVMQAVVRAAQRGVSCRILIDAIGAAAWWNGKQPRQLRAAGVEVQPALPVGFFRTFVGRTDLRLHRKIIVIDGTIGWTGSMNMVDPRYFKQHAGVGEWVDAMTRVEGAAVLPLAATMISDWILETDESLDQVVLTSGARLVDQEGTMDIQVIPSGPGESGDGLLQMILTLINSAHNELVVTTPYLVPDESLLRAIRGAAGRGVKVRLIVPEKVDSLLTRHASRSYYDDLLDVGAEIYLYRDGLLHTKSITVDGAVSMFGTVNLDMRSFWLNYEVSMFVYSAEFTAELRQLQQEYLTGSDRLEPDAWQNRSFGSRFVENTFRLVSPLL